MIIMISQLFLKLLYFINKYITTIHMYKESQIAADIAIQETLGKVWQKVAQKNIQKMVPTNVQKMNTYTFQSIAELHSQLLQPSDYINGVQDKESIPYDNLLNSFIKVQKSYPRSITQTNQINNNSFVAGSGVKIKVGKAVSKASNTYSKISTQRNKDNNPFKNLQQDLEPVNNRSNNQDLTRKIDFLRDRLLMGEYMNKKEAERLKIREKANLEREEILRKKKKQIDRFTYDYDGDFFSSKISNPENTLGAAARIKTDFQKDFPRNPKQKIDKIKPLFTTIVNQKLEQRYRRLATQKLENQKNIDMFKESIATRFANSFSEDNNLSEGISIKETTSNFTKFKPLNRVGQKLTLSEFKQAAASKKFKQFRTKPIKIIESHSKILRNKLTSYKSQQNFIQNNKIVKPELSEAYNPSQKNRRYKTMFRSEQSSILSNSQLSKNSIQSASKNGTIKISNPSLFKSVLHNEGSFII